MDIYAESLEFHRKLKGKIALAPKAHIESRHDLSLAYTPGVAEPCRAIAQDTEKVWEYTSRRNWVAVVSDGSAVLGLGNIGPEAALPVMEGKAVLFKEFADVDAFPICLATQDVDEIVETVKRLAPSFGGINLEDISAPRCFAVEERLKAELNIPVFHDDQHGTAIVVLAGLINACRLTQRSLNDVRLVISGVGAAGTAVARLLKKYAPTIKLIAVDSVGIIWSGRPNLGLEKQRLIDEKIIFAEEEGDLARAMTGADIFIGVSKPGILTAEHITTMRPNPIVFALSNPTPEIMPDIAKSAGAAIVATGRSDFPNQVNNVLAFPGLFRGVLDAGVSAITDEMKVAAAEALAGYVMNPTPDQIIPDCLDKAVAGVVASAVRRAISE